MTAQTKKLRVLTPRDLQELEEKVNRKPINFGAAIDKGLMEIAVHIPVFVAIGISAYGWEQYGAFAAGLVPLTLAISWLLSRSYSLVLKSKRWDVVLGVIVLGAFSFVWEAYGVHLGLERFNHVNEQQGLQVFAGWVLILASIMLGLMNVWSRRAFVTGHDVPADGLTGEGIFNRTLHRGRAFGAISRSNAMDNFAATGDGSQMTDPQAMRIRVAQGAWPVGYHFTADQEAIARRAAAN